jgi:hypothetical protein
MLDLLIVILLFLLIENRYNTVELLLEIKAR